MRNKYDLLEVFQVDSGTLSVTFEPSALAQITAAQINELAEKCLMINSKYGVPLFVRWGHEMNGDWTNYGYQPVAYKASYQQVSRAIRARTNMTGILF